MLFDFLRLKQSLQESGVLKGTADRHTHVLFGVDDGIRTLEDSLAVLEFEGSLGVTDVWCTPHIMEDIPNTTEALRARFNELCAAYNGPVKLHLAAEYMLDTLYEERLAARDLLLMEDDVVLVETSTIAAPYDLKGMIQETMAAGYRPLFAHPERCRFLEAGDCEELQRKGVRFQLNIASLVGYYGKAVRVKAESLLKKGIYSAYGSDCHRVRTVMDQYSRKELSKDTLGQLVSLK